MKKTFFLCMLILALLLTTAAAADPARFLKSDKNQAYHSEHLLQHLGSENCKVSGNYIKIRTMPGGNKVVGHLEKADVFSIDELDDHWAKITVLYSAGTSPDSRSGMTGWVDADYVECPCSSDEYYNGPARITYSLAEITAKTANLREEPSKSSTNHAAIKQGEQVEILSEYTGKDKKTWYRVRYNQQVGFIRSDMLEITTTGIPEAISAAEQAPVNAQAGVNESPEATQEAEGVSQRAEQTGMEAEEDFLQAAKPAAAEEAQSLSQTTGSADGTLPEEQYYDVYESYTWENAMYYQDARFDYRYYQGTWPETYAKILKSHETGIRLYEKRLSEKSVFYSGSGLKVLLQDLNGDGIPEMLFLYGRPQADYSDIIDADLYIYTNDGLQTRCALNVPKVHMEVNVGEWYALGVRKDRPVFLVQFYDGYGTWQLEYSAETLNLKSSLRCVVPVGEDPEEPLYYLNGEQISKSLFSSSYIPEDSGSVLWFANLDRTTNFPDNLSFDEVYQYLAEVQPTAEQVRKNAGYRFDDYEGLTIPVRVYSDTEVYHAGQPITFMADILAGVPPYSVHWQVSELQNRDEATPLDVYLNSHPEYENHTRYESDTGHVEFVYIPPVDSTTLFAGIGVTDAQGIGNYSMNEDVTEVRSPLETNSKTTDEVPDETPATWQEIYHRFIFGKEYQLDIHEQYDGYLEYTDAFGNLYYDYENVYLGLYDMNRDHLPELFVTDGYGLGRSCIYTVIGNQLCYVGSVFNKMIGPSPTVEESYPGVIAADGDSGLYEMIYYEMTTDYKLSQEKIFTIDYRNPDNPDKRLVSPVVTAVTSDATLCEIAKSDQLAWLFWVEETDMTEEAWDDFLLDGEWDWTLAGVRHDLDNEEYDSVDYSPFYRVFEPGKGDPLSSR